MRYTNWFRRSGDPDAPSGAVNLGKKLLGYLSNQRRLGAPETQVIRRIMDDGTLVVASFIGGIPKVAIYPTGTDLQPPACELYVESGLLDLGPNTAPDANERFNRGLPEFDDSPALLYFGDDVTCDDKLNGKVQIAPGRMHSQCLGEAGDAPVESRLTDPAKKQAQAVLPASCWTGLMHRYIAAIYGGDQVDYRLNGDGLEIGSGGSAATVSPWAGNTWGLLKIKGRLTFVQVTTDGVSYYDAVFTPCAAYVLRLWGALAKGSDEQKRYADKVLSIALSGCAPGKKIAALPLPATHDGMFSDYGFAFSETEAKAVGVVKRDGKASLVTLSIEEGVVTEALLEESVLPPSSLKPAPILLGPRTSTMLSSGEPVFGAEDVDVPVCAWYDQDNALVVLRYAFVHQAAPDIEITTCRGYVADGASHEFYAPHASDYYNPDLDCGVTARSGVLGSRERIPIRHVIIASGFYCAEQNWSQVETYSAYAKKHSNEMLDFILDRDPSFDQYPRRYIDVSFTFGSTETPTWTWSKVFDYNEASDFLRPGSTSPIAVATPPIPHTGACPYNSHTFESKEKDIFAATREWNNAGGVCPPGYEIYLAADVSEYASGSISRSWTPTVRSGVVAVGALVSRPAEYAVCARGSATSSWGVKYSPSGLFTGPPYMGNLYADYRQGVMYAIGATTETMTLHSTDGTCRNPEDYYDTTPATPFNDSKTESTPDVRVYNGPYASINWTGENPLGFPSATNTTPAIGGFCSEQFFVSTPWGGNTTVSGGLVDGTGDYSPTNVSTNSVSCPSTVAFFNSLPTSNNPIKCESEGGEVTLVYTYLDNEGAILRTNNYVARQSLLGANTVPDVNLNFGASIAMDRETISGGYPKVNWPSFVGWA